MTANCETQTCRVSDWRDLSGSLPSTTGWHHSGITVDEDIVYCAHPEGYALLAIEPEAPARVIPVPFAELHGIASGGCTGLIAVADPGWRMAERDGRRYEEETTLGRAALIRAEDGEIDTEFFQPSTRTYAGGGWRPTSITVISDAPTGEEVWISDGYGLSRVHRFSRSGEHLGEFFDLPDGTHFDCPHAIITHSRPEQCSELIIADRANHRLVVLSPYGDLLRTFGEEDLDSPSGLAQIDGHLFVTELHGGIAHFDPQERFVDTLEPCRARNPEEPAWPNLPGPGEGELLSPVPEPAVLNSPHGLAAHAGSLFMTEWYIGGRVACIDVSL